ncbi:MAG: hypothetical protein QM534_04325 [Sediminibacterium sp.]|nr:hypothetical protein [Sediminibacterium sp.]
MANSIIVSAQVVIPAQTSYYGNFPVTGGTLISLGFQNQGYQTRVYPTQLMIVNSGQAAFFQFDNLNSSPVTISIFGTVDNPSTVFGPVEGQGSINL